MSRVGDRAAGRRRRRRSTSSIDLDGTGATDVLDRHPVLRPHARPARPPRRVRPDGRRRSAISHIDTHHTVEDVAIALGEAFREALGDKAGVRRFASGRFPLDEALVEVALDLSGRPFVVWEVELPECLPLGNPAFDPQLAEHAVSSFATAAGITLHVTLRARPQRPPHHRGDVQGPARCLRDAVRVDRRRRRAVDEGCAVTSRCRRTARRGARLRHRQPALGAEGAAALRRRRPAHRRRRADRRRRRRRAARRRRVRGVHGRAARRAASRQPALDAVASGRPFLGICVGMQMLFDAQRGRRPAPRPRRDPRHDPLDPARRQAAADAVEPARRSATADDPMFAGLGRAAVGVLRALAARRARRPGDGRRDVRLRRRRSTPRSAQGNVFATQFHPEKSGDGRPGAARQLRPRRRRRRGRRDRRRALPGDRPARRPGRAPAAGRLRRRDRSTATTRSRSPPSFADAGRDVDPRRRPRRGAIGRRR